MVIARQSLEFIRKGPHASGRGLLEFEEFKGVAVQAISDPRWIPTHPRPSNSRTE